MISSILVNNITNITELKKNPVVLSNTDVTCVLSNGKPCFYTVSPEKMNDLLSLSKDIPNFEMLKDLFSMIARELSTNESEVFFEDCRIDKDTLKRIVFDIAVNYSSIGSNEELKDALGV